MRYTKVLRKRYAGIKAEHEAIKRGEDPQAIIPTGLREFDKRAGHKRKIFHLYGGETGVGKSIWKLHLMRSAAMAGYRVSVLDMEDPEERTADRDFSSATGINNAKMMSGDLTDEDVANIGLALAEAEGWADNIEISTGLQTAKSAFEWLDSSWSEEGEDIKPDLALIDYLSAFPHGKHGRERTISDFVWRVTGWCQEWDVAGVGFAQLTKEPSERGLRMYEAAKRKDSAAPPYIDGFRAYDTSELAWCSDAGKTAKELGFMFRPGRILKRLKHPAKDDRMEFEFPKRNFGGEGVIAVGFDGKTARLYDLPEKTKKESK